MFLFLCNISDGNQALITWYLLWIAANPVFSGIKISKTMTPTKMEGPMVNQRNTIARTICSGADHMLWRYVITSFSLSASTDIRFTISPIVLSRRALLLSLSACRGKKVINCYWWKCMSHHLSLTTLLISLYTAARPGSLQPCPWSPAARPQHESSALHQPQQGPLPSA